ncbi:hypothetical protein FPV67DRAFT_1669011 [Lyophyllum atratum]|nr:hypothetical protein FPV67DRAFT_1669011 [Lyophyllum atratum]
MERVAKLEKTIAVLETNVSNAQSKYDGVMDKAATGAKGGNKSMQTRTKNVLEKARSEWNRAKEELKKILMEETPNGGGRRNAFQGEKPNLKRSRAGSLSSLTETDEDKPGEHTAVSAAAGEVEGGDVGTANDGAEVGNSPVNDMRPCSREDGTENTAMDVDADEGAASNPLPGEVARTVLDEYSQPSAAVDSNMDLVVSASVDKGLSGGVMDVGEGVTGNSLQGEVAGTVSNASAAGDSETSGLRVDLAASASIDKALLGGVMLGIEEDTKAAEGAVHDDEDDEDDDEEDPPSKVGRRKDVLNSYEKLSEEAQGKKIGRARKEFRRFLQDERKAVSPGIRKMIRENQHLLPEAATISRSLALHILTSNRDNIQCLYHSKSKYFANSGQGPFAISGTPGPKRTGPNEKAAEGFLNCGCPVDAALLDFLIWKVWRVTLRAPGKPTLFEGMGSQILEPRTRLFIKQGLLDYAGLQLDDFYTGPGGALLEKDPEFPKFGGPEHQLHLTETSLNVLMQRAHHLRVGLGLLNQVVPGVPDSQIDPNLA